MIQQQQIISTAAYNMTQHDAKTITNNNYKVQNNDITDNHNNNRRDAVLLFNWHAYTSHVSTYADDTR